MPYANSPKPTPEFHRPTDEEAFRADMRIIGACLPGPCNAHGEQHEWSEVIEPMPFAVVDEHGYWVKDVRVCLKCLGRHVGIGGAALRDEEA